MKNVVVAVAIVVGLGAGCGGSAATTPEAALQKLLEAARNGDPTGFRAAFPSREELATMFDCPAGLDMAARYDGISDEFTTWRNARATLASGGFGAASAGQIAVGDAVSGCSAKRALNVSRADVRVTEGAADKTYAVRFVELDGTYRVLAF